MRPPPWHLIKRASILRPITAPAIHSTRALLTLAIETSCDDTSVAILEKHKNGSSTLHFHSKITSDNTGTKGIHPLVALHSHQAHLASLVQSSLPHLPPQRSTIAHFGNTLLIPRKEDAEQGVPAGNELQKKPDFVSVTRGPGMRANLNTGIEVAKGLSLAWGVPLVGVHHMQAHALTPRLVSSLERANADEDSGEKGGIDPQFPFLSLLVSGGHTLLVESKALCEHRILASTSDMAVGDVLDKCARDILPASIVQEAGTVMYAPLLEKFAFTRGAQDYDYKPPLSREERNRAREMGYGWSITPPLSRTQMGAKADLMEYSFSGLGSTVERIMVSKPEMDIGERRVLAREAMRIAFEHLASRLLIALQGAGIQGVTAVVVSGGVASNQYLKHILRAMLDAQGFHKLKLIFPPPSLCTDNAAMIAWTGIEMWEAGYRSSLGISALRKWALDPQAEDGGILGVDGWVRGE